MSEYVIMPRELPDDYTWQDESDFYDGLVEKLGKPIPKDLTREQIKWIAEEICDNRGVLNVSPTFLEHLLENMPKVEEKK